MSVLWLWHGGPVDVVLCVDGPTPAPARSKISEDVLGRAPGRHLNLRYRISRSTLVQVQAMSADEDLFAQRRAEVLRLTYAENLSVRAISRRLESAQDSTQCSIAIAPSRAQSRRARLAPALRRAIRQALSDTPQMRAPAMLGRLRSLGYRGGITIVRERLRQLRPHAEKEPFLHARLQ